MDADRNYEGVLGMVGYPWDKNPKLDASFLQADTEVVLGKEAALMMYLIVKTSYSHIFLPLLELPTDHKACTMEFVATLCFKYMWLCMRSSVCRPNCFGMDGCGGFILCDEVLRGVRPLPTDIPEIKHVVFATGKRAV